jgi:hypothetical protein
MVTLKVNNAGLGTPEGYVHLCRPGSIPTQFSKMIRLGLDQHCVLHTETEPQLMSPSGDRYID